MREKKFDRSYLCIGIVHIPPIAGQISDCGVTRTLGEWLDLFYPGKNPQEYFKYDSENEILKYLLDHADHRMVRADDSRTAEREGRR